MYLLDWKIPKRLEKVRDEMFLTFTSSYQDIISSKQKDLANKALSCFVYNASYHVARGSTEFDITLHKNHYSRPLIYNGNVVSRQVSYTWTKKILEWMVKYNMIELDKGAVEVFKIVDGRCVPDKLRNSLVRLSEGLIDHIKPVSSIEQEEILRSVLELRGESGDVLPFTRYQQQEKLISLLNTYNLLANVSEVSVDSKEFHVQLKKVFNVDFSQGGRSYLVGAAITTELLKKENRGKILIGGDRTLEIDYKHHHCSIIAEMEGYVFPEGFDPYGIELCGYDSKCLRSIAKLAMLILINSDSNRQAAQALSFEMFNKLPLQDWKGSGLVPDPVETKRVIDCIYEHNQYAKDWFCSRKGLHLQQIDSLMMDVVLGYWNQRGVVVLPIHDSIVIQEKYLDEALHVMRGAYCKILNTDFNCKLEVKKSLIPK